jgi:hypothetical protein
MALTKSWWQSVVSRWWVVSPYSRWDVRDQAEADGALSPPVPGPDDPIAPWYVGAMKEHFDNIARGILANFQEEDESHRLAISQLESDESAAREALCRTKKAYDEAADYFRKNNPDIPVESVRQRVAGYALITAFFFILEFPMNFAAFKLFGDNANLLTAATAAAIGGALLVLAHFLGIAWHKGPIRNRAAMVDVVVIVTLALLAIVSVAELRTAYLVNNPEAKLRESGTLMRSFAVFNLMLFGCAAFISRHRHMTGIDLVAYSGKALKKARERQERLERQLGMARKKREVLRLTNETEVHRVTDQHLELDKRYHMHNTRVRNDRKEGCPPLNPPYMKEVSTSSLVSIPKHFAERLGVSGPDGKQTLNPSGSTAAPDGTPASSSGETNSEASTLNGEGGREAVIGAGGEGR